MSSAFMLIGSQRRKDPFHEDPPGKAFYHPSRQKQLSKKERKIALNADGPEEDERVRSKADQRFLSGSNKYRSRIPRRESSPQDPSSKFDESWPESERPSTISIPSLSDSPGQMDPGTYRTKSLLQELYHKYNVPERDTAGRPLEVKEEVKGSTLSKYIERFRHGEPKSRQERQQDKASNPQDFWWLSSHPPTPTDSSTPKDDSRTKVRGHEKGKDSWGKEHSRAREQPRLTESLLKRLDQLREGKTSTSDTRGQQLDADTQRLQERADRLLEKTSSSMNASDPIISTDGLGSTMSGSTYTEQAYRPAFTRTHEPGPSHKPTRTRDGEDILQQWRLQRKMELARQRVLGGSAGTETKNMGQSDGGAATAVQKDEIESKLADFRRRLAQATSTPMKPANIQFTQAPKADAVCQTSAEKLLDEPVQDQQPPGRPSHNMPAEGSHSPTHSPIASPHLPRKFQHGHDHQVSPHHHLICDIMPCPCPGDHPPHYAKQYAKYGADLAASHEFPEPSREIPEKDHGVQRSAHRVASDRADNGRTATCLSGVQSKLKFDSLTSSSEVTQSPCSEEEPSVPGKYAQIPDKTGHRAVSKDAEHPRFQSSDRRKHEQSPKPDYPEKDHGKSDSVQRGDFPGKRKGGKQMKYSTNQSDSTDNRKYPRKTDKDSLRQDETELKRRSTRHKPAETSREPVPERDETSHRPAGSSRDAPERDGTTSHGRRWHQPTHHSTPHTSSQSPKASVSGAVGQVVGQRLFDSLNSSLSVASSRDSMASPHVAITTQDLELAVASDEDEFPSDRMLVELRQKREDYLQRLREIDVTLSQGTGQH